MVALRQGLGETQTDEITASDLRESGLFSASSPVRDQSIIGSSASNDQAGKITDPDRSMLVGVIAPAAAQTGDAPGLGKWVSFAGNLTEAGYRKTQFFDPHYDTAVIQWDSRMEVWLPPWRDKFSWGPYLRVAGIAGSRSDAWQNAWLGAPGIGIQLYPFSSSRFRQRRSETGAWLGPVRFFAEYNRTIYWGSENEWRPRKQIRAGFEYWKAVNVNEPGRLWWIELWNGWYWQSSNEFTNKYNAPRLGNAVRAGIRVPKRGLLSTITPYIALESSRTKYDYDGTRACAFGVGNCDFYWEDRLLVGGGLRFAPSLRKMQYNHQAWLNRFVVYGEYLNTATYYGPVAPSSVPRYDVRIGVSASIGDWYR